MASEIPIKNQMEIMLRTSITAQGTILGTFQYMAPEQIEGLDADARTDVFAFGALLFRCSPGGRRSGQDAREPAWRNPERRTAAGVAAEAGGAGGARSRRRHVPREGSGRSVSDRPRSAARSEMGGVARASVPAPAKCRCRRRFVEGRVVLGGVAAVALAAWAMVALQRGRRGSPNRDDSVHRGRTVRRKLCHVPGRRHRSGHANGRLTRRPKRGVRRARPHGLSLVAAHHRCARRTSDCRH